MEVNPIEKIIKKRRSCRKFIDKPIPQEMLLKLIEAGTWAPSASNSQNYRFLIIDNKKEIEYFAKFKQPHNLIKSSSAIIIVLCDRNIHKPKPEELYIWEKIWCYNCAAAIQNILLLSTEHKIGSCWVAAIEEMNKTRLLSGKTWKELLKDYKIPKHYDVHGIVLLGYPKETDSGGYPKGDIKHGEKLVQRPPAKEFLICKKKN